MYSAQGSVDAQGRVDVTAIDAQGEQFTPDLHHSIAGLVRAELDWTTALPEYVCEIFPRAERVTVQQPDQERTVRCG